MFLGINALIQYVVCNYFPIENNSDYCITLSLFINSFQKEILTLTTLNVLIGHHLDFTEADWLAQ